MKARDRRRAKAARDAEPTALEAAFDLAWEFYGNPLFRGAIDWAAEDSAMAACEWFEAKMNELIQKHPDSFPLIAAGDDA